MREIFGFKKKANEKEAQDGEEVAEIESMDEEMKMQEEMQRLEEQGARKKKKQRRLENERKQNAIRRMQMGIISDMGIGMEQAGPQGEDSIFQLSKIENAGLLSKVAKGRMAIIEPKKQLRASAPSASDEEASDSDSEEDKLESELDSMYQRYVETKSAKDAKYRAKRARKQDDDEEWHGFSDSDKVESSDDEILEDDATDISDEEDAPNTLITDLDNDHSSSHGLTKRASRFFDQDIFKGIEDELDTMEDDSGIDVEEAEESAEVATVEAARPVSSKMKHSLPRGDPSEPLDGDDVIEEVKRDEAEGPRMKNGRPDIDIITAEAMTLAHSLATGQKSKHDLLDDGFHRYSLRDMDGLPDWFLDDENKHSKIQRPITAAAAAAIKEKMRALNARPIKKVREAKARKKFKAAQRLEKLKKKSALLADEDGMTEKDKAQTIAKLMSKAVKKKPKQKVTLVVARGGNKSLKGRPRGTKGKYKMVDSRLKKDVRAEKRLAKKRR